MADLSRHVLEIPPLVIGLALFLIPPWLVLRRLRSGRPLAVPPPILDDGAGGRTIPLVAAFSGLRWPPWIALASNNLNPSLVMAPHGVTCRVLMRRTRAWHEVERVDVRIFGATVNLDFVFRGSAVTFTANVGSVVLAARVLALVPEGIPLTDRARSVLAGGGGSSARCDARRS